MLRSVGYFFDLPKSEENLKVKWDTRKIYRQETKRTGFGFNTGFASNHPRDIQKQCCLLTRPRFPLALPLLYEAEENQMISRLPALGVCHSNDISKTDIFFGSHVTVELPAAISTM